MAGVYRPSVDGYGEWQDVPLSDGLGGDTMPEDFFAWEAEPALLVQWTPNLDKDGKPQYRTFVYRYGSYDEVGRERSGESLREYAENVPSFAWLADAALRDEEKQYG